MINVTLRGLERTKRHIKKESTRQRKAHEFVIRREAFRLRGELKNQVRQGAPGGKRFEKLTRLARRKRDKKGWLRDNPLSRLANPIFYHVRSRNPFEIAVGWTGPKVSEGLRRIVKRQQEGFNSLVSDLRRRYFMHRGDELPKRSAFRDFFFIKKRSMETPAREIMDPFWDAEEKRAIKNIRKNFRLKLRGNRI